MFLLAGAAAPPPVVIARRCCCCWLLFELIALLTRERAAAAAAPFREREEQVLSRSEKTSEEKKTFLSGPHTFGGDRPVQGDELVSNYSFRLSLSPPLLQFFAMSSARRRAVDVFIVPVLRRNWLWHARSADAAAASSSSSPKTPPLKPWTAGSSLSEKARLARKQATLWVREMCASSCRANQRAEKERRGS